MTQRWIPDNSAIAAFRESPEKFRLRYRLGLVPQGPALKMRAGSAIHAGRNVLYDWRKGALDGTNVPLEQIAYTPDVVERAVQVARAHRGPLDGPRNADHVERVVRTYAAKYAVEPFAVVENEKYVEARIHTSACVKWHNTQGIVQGDLCTGAIGGCFDFCGIQDAVVRFPDGSEYVMDTKSTGAYLGADWERAARLGDQFVGYVAMRRALGLRCDGFFVDAIHMNDPRPRKDGSYGEPKVDESDFQRVGPVSVPEWRVERWAADMRYTLAAIAALDAERGPEVPWPAYQNWAYGKVDEYAEFAEVAPELHGSVRQQYAVEAWSPAQVAEERKPTETT